MAADLATELIVYAVMDSLILIYWATRADWPRETEEESDG